MSVRTQISASREAISEVFRNPALKRINVAYAASIMGDCAYGVGVGIYAYIQGGATAVGVLGVVRYVSAAVMTPFSATLADRYDRRRIMVRADLVRFVLVMAAAGVVFFDGPALVVYALAVLASLASTAFRPAQAALLPRLARHPDELTAANVTSSTIESVGFFAGPAIAGVLIAFTEIDVVFVFNALTFLWSAIVIGGLVVPDRADGPAPEAVAVARPGPDADVPAPSPVVATVGAEPPEAAGVAMLERPRTDMADGNEPPTGPPADERPAGFLSEASQGFRTILGNRDIRLIIGVYAAQTVVAGASLVFTVAVALDLLDLDQAAVGVMDAALGVGGLVGGVVALILAQRSALARDFGVGVIAWAAPLILISAIPRLWSALVAMVIIGVANSVVDVNAFTVLQRLVPDEVMGRVFGAMESTIIAGMALGSLMMPLLISTVGLRTGLTIIGVAVTAVGLSALPSLGRIDTVALAPAGVATLRAVPMLAALSRDVLEQLAHTSELRHYDADQVVFAEGDAGDHFHVIEQGAAAVIIHGERVAEIGPGDCFGEIALLRDIPRTATVMATRPLVTRTLSREDFVPAVTGHGGARHEADRVVSGWLAVL